MARARNIKPSFFKNELLVELSPYDRLLFIGLWCLADREGRLEDRPKRIKMELFPADSYEVEHGLAELHSHGFLHRYTARGQRYIQIVNFSKHQSPHCKEAPSAIPPLDEQDSGKAGAETCLDGIDHGASTVQARCKQQPKNVPAPPDSLIPDSLIPDSGFSDSIEREAAVAAAPAPANKAKRAARLPEDWQLPKPWGEWTLANCPGWTVEKVRFEADKFADHYRAKAGKDACKTDWQATWRNWCRRDLDATTRKPARTPGSRVSAPEAVGASIEDAVGSMFYDVIDVQATEVDFKELLGGVQP